jgi:hypothetical protein
MKLQPVRRPLTQGEQRQLRAQFSDLRVNPLGLAALVGIFVALWLATVLFTEGPVLLATVVWAGLGGVATLSAYLSVRRTFGRRRRALKSALKRNAGDVFDIRARAFVEFAEVEDEGACYAFELDNGCIVFVIGQDFYADDDFPSLDFAIVHALDQRDQVAEMILEKRGPKVKPVRIVPAPTKATLHIPFDLHLETVDGPLDAVEQKMQAPAR